jgi:hypothetical protein
MIDGDADRLTPPPVLLGDLARTLADDWDAEFAWSYGRQFWNIGCG